MPPDVLPDRPSGWITSSYTVKLENLQTVLQKFGCPTPTVDAFASAADGGFPRYWTEIDSAWQQSWSKEIICANLPFEWLEQVVETFISDKGEGILLLPDYSSTCISKEAN